MGVVTEAYIAAVGIEFDVDLVSVQRDLPHLADLDTGDLGGVTHRQTARVAELGVIRLRSDTGHRVEVEGEGDCTDEDEGAYDADTDRVPFEE